VNPSEQPLRRSVKKHPDGKLIRTFCAFRVPEPDWQIIETVGHDEALKVHGLRLLV
jgi:hypothetical protein